MKLLKAIDYIETRLTAELTLGDIARAAGLSSFHFSRMFRALTGETVATYLRRRRLTEAALLAQPRRTVIAFRPYAGSGFREAVRARRGGPRDTAA